MNTTQAQQKAHDDALVSPADRLEFRKCNMRLKTDIKPKEATFQVVLDALAFTSFYHAFLITADVPAIYMQEFRATVSVHKQKFKDLTLERDILSFIRDLGHNGDITYLTDVNVDYLHQPCRAFTTVINKCLSGKETGMNKIHLSSAQILWDSKKTNKMSYPRFTKIIIDYFMSKDQSILKRNKIFWHTSHDDTMFTSMRCISRHEDTQVYGTILPKELTNQAMLESNAYKTYYAFASGKKAPKPKYVQKKVDPDTSPKQKLVQATKGTKLKSKAKVAKSDKKKQPVKKLKAKGLAVLSESKVLDEQQQKSSGIDEGTGIIPGVPDVPIYKYESEKESWGDSKDEDNENNSNDISDEGDDDNDGNHGDDDDATDDDKQEGDDTNNDDEETDSDRIESDRIKIPILDQSTIEFYEEEEEENIDDEEKMYDDEDNEVTKELYEDVNVNLGNEDTDITNADQGASEQQNVSQESRFEQVEEDAYVTLTPLLNLDNPSPTDNKIASLINTTAQHATSIPEITSSFTTTVPPPPPFFYPLQQEAAPTPTPTASETTTSLPALLDFASVFKFTERVFNLEKDVSKIKQVDQLQTRSSDEKNACIELVDTSMRALIKEEANTQLPQILPQAVSDFATHVIEKNVTELVKAAVLTRSSSQPTSTYEAAALLSEFELTNILIDKIEKSKSYNKADYKNKLYDALVESYNTDKDLFDSYGEVFSFKRSRDEDKDRDPSAGSDRGKKRRKSSKDDESSRDSRSKEKKSSSTSKDASQSQHKASGKSAHREEPSHTVEDSGMQQYQEFITGDNDEQPTNKEVTKAVCQVAHAEEPPTSFNELNDTSFDFSAFVMNQLKIPNLTQEILVGPTFNLLKGTCKSITELEYHLEECSKATTERLDWHNPENKPYPFDLKKPLSLIQDHRGRQIIPKDYFINKDLEYLKGGDLSR
ncbi:hypothetical protein Tco_1093937 [Tanacetum coccineum]|uniref:Uncharacterized protein n=1 Tax=Tanacetum coccineum TaxID=301880 RepID=A0ABQ5IFH1_9ASTR